MQVVRNAGNYSRCLQWTLSSSSLRRAGCRLTVIFFALLFYCHFAFAESGSVFSAVRPVSLSQNPEFQHSVRLGSISGLPATIRIEKLPSGVDGVRLLLEDAVQFLVIPLRRAGVPGAFEAQIPTPEKKFRYRFQLLLADGGRTISNSFEMIPFCGAREIKEALDRASSDERRQSLVREAIALERDVQRLRYVIRVLDERADPLLGMNRK